MQGIQVDGQTAKRLGIEVKPVRREFLDVGICSDGVSSDNCQSNSRIWASTQILDATGFRLGSPSRASRAG